MVKTEVVHVGAESSKNPYSADLFVQADEDDFYGLARIVPPFTGGDHLLAGIRGNSSHTNLQHIVSNNDATILSFDYIGDAGGEGGMTDVSQYAQAKEDVVEDVKDLITMLGGLSSAELFRETAEHTSTVLLCDNNFKYDGISHI